MFSLKNNKKKISSGGIKKINYNSTLNGYRNKKFFYMNIEL